MANKGHIHWHEGLFLQPHHLQAQQRQMLDGFADERRLGWAYPYGVVDARVSADAIENMLVRFDRLVAVMPSGTVVDFPETADLPPLDIKKAFAADSSAFTIYLGIPLYYPNRANTVDSEAAGGAGAAAGSSDWRVNRVFRLAEVELRDENTGQNAQAALVRRLNARLLLDGDDRTDLEVIPVLRIVHAAGPGVGLPRQDPAFIPPCLVLTGSATLREMVRDLGNGVDASRKELASQMARGGFTVDAMRGAQFEQAIRLQTLSRASVRLGPLASTPAVTPLVAYQELRQLLAELTALEPGQGDGADVAPYDHNNLALSFGELSMQLRMRLRATVAARYLNVTFARGEDRLLTAALTAEHLAAASEFFLAVQSKQDPRAVVTLVEDADRFKLLAKSFANQRIFGVKLAEERHPPVELPAQGGMTYFRLLRTESARMWERVVAEHAIAARWIDMESSDFSLVLYMTVASDRGSNG
jgi:type VI secretion system ImpJ/VasE family protein